MVIYSHDANFRRLDNSVSNAFSSLTLDLIDGFDYYLAHNENSSLTPRVTAFFNKVDPIKKALFFAVLIAINYVFIELISYGFYRLKFGDYDRHSLQLQRIDTINSITQGAVYTAEDFGDKKVVVKEILHPYIGYSVEGQRRDDNCNGDDCYQRIKVDSDKPFVKRSNDKLIIGILGGSVAAGSIRGAGKDYYQEKLTQLPEYQGKEVILYAMAGGGFRQPQQLMLLNYYYSLGAEFDLIVNLDGFNDVAIPATEYNNTKLHPSFPRSWGNRVSSTVSQELISLYADKKNLQSDQVSSATFMSNPWSRNSPLSNLLWTIKHHRYMGSLSELNIQIASFSGNENDHRDYEKVGPDYTFTDWPSLYQYAVEIWATSSQLMYASAQAKGTKYFHFLQPNQYVEGSKPNMNEQERAAAFVKKGYGTVYKAAYPFIQQKAAWFRDNKIPYYDLSDLYQEIEAPIYIDNCCHVNALGSSMLVDKIVETIHQYNINETTKRQLLNSKYER